MRVAMTDRIRIIKHEAVPDCGSYEVRFADGREFTPGFRRSSLGPSD